MPEPRTAVVRNWLGLVGTRPAWTARAVAIPPMPKSVILKMIVPLGSKRPPNPFVQCATRCGPVFHGVGLDLWLGR